MITDGIYRIYKLRHDQTGETHRKLAARLLVHQGICHHLEDHHDMEDLFPEGQVTPQFGRRLTQLAHSGYHEVVHEDDLHAGHHPEYVEPLDIGAVEPEARFIMTGEGLVHPQHVEMYEEAIYVDGKRLDDNDAHHLMTEVSHGRLHLQPV